MGMFLLFPIGAIYCWYLWIGDHTLPRHRWGEGDNWQPGMSATSKWFYDREVNWLVRGGAIFFTVATLLLLSVSTSDNAAGLRCLFSFDPTGVGACQPAPPSSPAP